MLKIEKTVLPSPEQWEIMIEGMRNPMNSWHLMDSYKTHVEDAETLECADFEFFLGDNDHKLMMGLAKGGAVHAKYRRMIPVFLTIDAPLYWWKEFDAYKIGTVANSCSTMHKIHAKEFTMDDFSCEHLNGIYHECSVESFIEIPSGSRNWYSPRWILENVIIKALNTNREKFLETKDKKYWWHMIQLLPSSYNQKRTVMVNYEVLAKMHVERRHHKLDEWHTFCDWVEQLPHADIMMLGE